MIGDEKKSVSVDGVTALPPMSKPTKKDGYDIQAERIALSELLDSDADPDPNHPLYSRLEKYWEEEERLKSERKKHQARNRADGLVSDLDAWGLSKIGKLVDEEDPKLEIHTREAMRLFVGQAPGPEQKDRPIAGGKRAGACLKSLWFLSGNDNPYADWILITSMEQITNVRNELDVEIVKQENVIAFLKKRGLHFNVSKNRTPVQVKLGFRSPYGYSVVELIMTFDYYYRLIRTMVDKDRMSGSEGREQVRKYIRKVRSCFEAIQRYERILMREELRLLRRSDFLGTGDEPALLRAVAAVKIFGPVPKEVFERKLEPRHSRNKINLSEKELKLLQSADLDMGLHDQEELQLLNSPGMVE